MHVYFSGIGGAGMGPLALIAKQAGFEVSGSDEKESQYIKYLTDHGISNIQIGQTKEQIAGVHQKTPIDWFVYTLALPMDGPEMIFCRDNGIKATSRVEFTNEILSQNKLKLVAVAGTHGKTTTTAMVTWLFGQLAIPVSYSIGAKIGFGDMGHFSPGSKFFVYECDEFKRAFLGFRPKLAIITGLSWDHHEVFSSQQDYYDAFKQFVSQTEQTVIWQSDADKIGLEAKILNKSSISDRAGSPGEERSFFVESESNTLVDQIKLLGVYNRRDAWLAVRAVSLLTNEAPERLIKLIGNFPGVSRRFERIADNLYSDYAHTPDKIRGVMSVALEATKKTGQKLVIIYEPLTNRRMHYMKGQHQAVFSSTSKLYWVPSYLAREDPNQPILKPAELIEYLDTPTRAIASPMELDEGLKTAITNHLAAGDLVIGLSGGGGGSLDEWLRQKFGN